MTEKQQLFLDALFGDAQGDFKKAKEIAGYGVNTSIPAIVAPLEEEIEKRTRQFIAVHGPKAAFSLMSVLDNPAEIGNTLKLAAAKDILDRAGFSKTDKIEVKTETPLFILPSKDKTTEDE